MLIYFLALFVLFIIISGTAFLYFSLVKKVEAIKDLKKAIDFQLDIRFKIFEELITISKTKVDYEETVLKEIIQLRSHAESCKTKGKYKSQFQAEEKISKIVHILFDSYPEFKESESIKHMQEDISSNEQQLGIAQKKYNDLVKIYIIAKQVFLNSLIISLFKKKLNHDFEYWTVSKNKASDYKDFFIKL